MLILSLKPGQYLDIGEDIRIVFTGGSANNIKLMVDAPKEMNVVRSVAAEKHGTARSDAKTYYKEDISQEAHQEINKILREERRKRHAQHAEG